MPTERTLARVCREAGATVLASVKVWDMNISVSATNNRAIEVLAMGLPLHEGAQLAIDVTLRLALTTTGGTMSRWRDNERCGAPVCTTGEAGQVQGTVGRSPFRFGRRWGGDWRPVSPGGR